MTDKTLDRLDVLRIKKLAACIYVAENAQVLLDAGLLPRSGPVPKPLDVAVAAMESDFVMLEPGENEPGLVLGEHARGMLTCHASEVRELLRWPSNGQSA